jgi:hypothetical protein
MLNWQRSGIHNSILSAQIDLSSKRRDGDVLRDGIFPDDWGMECGTEHKCAVSRIVVAIVTGSSLP